ncbi:MAG: GatB/YqeY domain-containing protein [Terriglobales bacterium]
MAENEDGKAKTIADTIHKDMTDAMRAREELRLSTLRMMKSAVKSKEIDKRAPLEDAETLQILSTMIKQRKESIEQFNKGGRPELAEKEAAEIVIIEAYMPQSASQEQVDATVKATIAEMGSPTGSAPTMKDMGTVMKNAMAKFAAAGTRVDGKMVSEAVKRELAGK